MQNSRVVVDGSVRSVSSKAVGSFDRTRWSVAPAPRATVHPS